MPTQTFRITQAPESKRITDKELQDILTEHRKDTEWDVRGSKRSMPMTIYEIYRDGKHVATWDKGSIDRYGIPMDDERFRLEFEDYLENHKHRVPYGHKHEFEMRIRRIIQ